MSSINFDSAWIWHPDWVENPASSSAGGFVNFRKELVLDHIPQSPIRIQVSADTRYKLYINSRLVHAGPVKGDQQAWFFDELDIQPHLQPGINYVAIRVLRFYYASRFASSFPRTPFPGLLVRHVRSDHADLPIIDIHTNESWETSIDASARLPNDMKDDDFLHIFEEIDGRRRQSPIWVSAVSQKFLTSFGLATPWRLSPRMIPYPRLEPAAFKAVHNIRSSEARSTWENMLLQPPGRKADMSVLLPAGTVHHVELEAEHHTTAYIAFRFLRPAAEGSRLFVTYSECYEDEPVQLPYIRAKGDRCDTSKCLFGPRDRYVFAGPLEHGAAMHHSETEEYKECFAPFHFRTFRFVALDIEVASGADLVLQNIDITTTNYPLQVTAEVNPPADAMWVRDLWTVSLRTLINCMHDCYEDCPFYEQLQYAMDTRSSALFTYCISGDDRLARQAIIQLHNSFQPAVGLTASRAPAHHLQIIPHFSLFWACMLVDHYDYFGDASYVSKFLSTSHAILETFNSRIDAGLGLVRSVDAPDQWDFVDWVDTWKPFGIPPAARRTGFQTFTNSLYAYTLKRLAAMLSDIGRENVAGEYNVRADAIVRAIRDHCFDGHYFTDGLARGAEPTDYSQHNQVWAVLCGAVSGETGASLLTQSLATAGPTGTSTNLNSQGRTFTLTSTAMSFYTFRALSQVGRGVYEAHFSRLWDPWRAQLAQNVTTWVEDNVSQRSDCHAWGSLPLYEFIAEVAGVKPAAPGWAAISFKPRLNLFRTFDVRVPIGGTPEPRVARVQWITNERDAKVKVILSVESVCGASLDGDVKLPIHHNLPDGRNEIVYSSGVVEFIVDMSAATS
ncbi:Six-hairpin glycosidase-like protein [Dactylonectria estremocensis]|uniref:Six-hairpin glycosidase-like protein n=1 Tax=Dactylonectria estremocensis TaxID=1079267 RepID=A0A9P9EUE9_9HYPO|nr:Six-hairpin glycosidase-like protein [Dactylonectria estremocensis]